MVESDVRVFVVIVAAKANGTCSIHFEFLMVLVLFVILSGK